MSALQALKDDCKSRGWKINTRTRNLASGPKLYIRIRGTEEQGAYPHTRVSRVVKEHFPESYLTSGGCGGLTGEVDLTYAEGPPM